MKKKLSNLMIILIFIAGLSLLVYPLIANKWNNYRQEKLIQNYQQALLKKEETIDYENEIQKAKVYNQALAPHVLPDSFANTKNSKIKDQTYLSALNLTGDGMMGIIEIPKINVKLPIYHTTSKEVLEKATGHLEGSSLPIGGKGNHAVISAHRGLPSATLFTDLDQLKKGNHFLIHILNKTLCYQVDRIEVVKPEETSSLKIKQGKDYVSLLTCTPYGINDKRLIVRGHRVAYSEKEIQNEEKNNSSSMHTRYGLWVFVGLSVTSAFIFGLYRKDKRIKAKVL